MATANQTTILHRYRYPVFLIVIYFLAEIIVHPAGEFPLNDDWCYAKSVRNWLLEGEYSIGTWPAMTLWTHLAFGLLVTKVTGFSFLALRISMLILSGAGLLFLYGSLRLLRFNPLTALFLCFFVLFNPIYFVLANTYMTDVSFHSLLMAGIYCGLRYFERPSAVSLFAVFVLSILLTLTRQYGLVLPFSFCAGILVHKTSTNGRKAIALLLSGLVLFILKLYEGYLQSILPAGSMYEFTTQLEPKAFAERVHIQLAAYGRTILLHLLVFASFPLSVLTVPLCTRLGWIKSVFLAAFCVCTVFFLFRDTPFPVGNTFYNAALGTESFYQNLSPERSVRLSTTWNTTFETFAWMFKIPACAISLFVVLGNVAGIGRSSEDKRTGPRPVFLAVMLIGYLTLLYLSSSFFDRYLLPALSLIVILAFLRDGSRNIPRVAFLTLLPLIWISVCGTSDYLSWNRTKWQAYYALKEQGVAPEKINGGFEISCWNEGKPAVHYAHLFLANYEYLIQFDPEPDFREFRSFPFYRRLQLRNDTLKIYVRQTAQNE